MTNPGYQAWKFKLWSIDIQNKTNINRHRVNDDISSHKVRLVMDDNNSSVVSLTEALKRADDEGLDLVEVAPDAKPPVCRVMDYGKFLFEQGKKKQASRKKQKQIQLKEIKFRPSTGEGDYQIKLKSLVKFLESGNKTKVTIRYRGREMVHHNIGKELLERIAEDLADFGKVEQFPKLEGRQMVMVVAPISKK